MDPRTGQPAPEDVGAAQIQKSPKCSALTILIFHLCSAKLQLQPKPGPVSTPDPDSELIPYEPNSAPCRPSCGRHMNERFNKQHLATLSSYGTDRKLWTKYIRRIKVCSNKSGIKSFLDKSEAKQVEKKSPKCSALTILIFHLCSAKLQLQPKPGPVSTPDPDSELIPYEPNSAPCRPSCGRHMNERFNKQHLATLSSYGTDRRLWTKYIRRIKVCSNKSGIKSFLDKSEAKQVEKVCSPSGGKLYERGKNLCISNQAFSFIEVHWDENCEVWKVSNVYQHIILACDEIEVKCLPVHFQTNSQNRQPDEKSLTCSSSEEEEEASGQAE
ncbi:hypothetical protein AOLI_G00041750 [Acnodon oligacanthus]